MVRFFHMLMAQGAILARLRLRGWSDRTVLEPHAGHGISPALLLSLHQSTHGHGGQA